MAAVAASVLGLSLVVSGCSGGSQSGDEAEASQSGPSAESSNGVRDASERLLVECGQKVESPGLDAIEVDTAGDGYGTSPGVSAHADGLDFGFILDNQTDLVAVGVGYTFRFIGDGEDVTNELGNDFAERWGGGHGVVESLDPRGFLLGDSTIEKPDGWEDLDLKIEAEVTGVDYWCTYEEPGPYSG